MSCLRSSLLAGCAALAAAASTAWGAVTIQDVHATNVGTTEFSVVWTTSDVSTPGLDVFADSEGTQPLNDAIGLEFYPVAEGDPAVVNDAEARAMRRSLQNLAINRRVVVVRVSGLSPGTSYFFRPRTFADNGSDNGAGVVPLQPVTTAQFTSFVADGRLLQVRFPALAAEGMVALVEGPGDTLPLSMIVGDSNDGETALIPLANLIDGATGTNAVFDEPFALTIRLLGAEAPAGTFTQLIDPLVDFAVAAPLLIETDLSSPSPFFTQHPTPATGFIGTSVTFQVAASGTPAPGYLWQRKPAGTETWADLVEGDVYSGTATAELTVSGLTLEMSGDAFRARASNGVPPDAWSDPAVLTVELLPVAPLILQHPQPAATLAGGSAQFTVSASGSPEPDLRWQRKAAGSDTWSDLVEDLVYVGVATPQLTVTGATLVMNGDAFRAVANNGVDPEAVSQAALLTVTSQAVAPEIVEHPQPQEVGLGATAAFDVLATGTPTPDYRWQRKPAGGDAWLDLSDDGTHTGTGSASLSVIATVDVAGSEYRAIAANGTAPDAVSASALLTVLMPAKITAQPEPVVTPSGAVVHFSVTAEGHEPLEYQWQVQPEEVAPWQDVPEGGIYSGTTTPTLTIDGVLPGMNGSRFRVVVSNAIGEETSSAAALTVVTATQAEIALSELHHVYDGSGKSVVVTTTPENLAVTLTYNGGIALPILPGTYTVEAVIAESGYVGSTTAELVITTAFVARQVGVLAGGIDGSLQVLDPTNVTLNGWISGDLLVPGSPTVANNSAAFGGIVDATGSAQPSNHTVTLSPTSVLSHVVRRVDPVVLPTVAAPPMPSGTRIVTLSIPGQNPGDFSTIRNLNLLGTVGEVRMPPGSYGNITVNGNAQLILGVEGATEPSVYNLQALVINTQRGTAALRVVGPVIINVNLTLLAGGLTGNPDHPEWLQMNLAGNLLSVPFGGNVHGYVLAPAADLNVSNGGSLRGGAVVNRISIMAGAVVEQVTPEAVDE